MQYKAVARLFCTGAGVGGIIASAEGASLVGGGGGGGVGGSVAYKIFKFGGSETLFSALVMRYVSEKSTWNKCEKTGVFSTYKCTTIKITESKENKSIHRLDLCGSTGPGGQLPPPAHPASYGFAIHFVPAETELIT